MLDRYNRNINYLRISVTDRCNLRCRYCMPEEGVRLIRHEDILTYDEITAFTRVAVAAGISKVRITGGEPLVRKGVTGLVRMIAAIDGVTDLSITTNGILLAAYATELEAGLMRVNVSLDSIDPVKYSYVTRGGNLYSVLEGIEAAQKAGLRPVKINCVIKSRPDESDALKVAEYSMKEGLRSGSSGRWTCLPAPFQWCTGQRWTLREMQQASSYTRRHVASMPFQRQSVQHTRTGS